MTASPTGTAPFCQISTGTLIDQNAPCATYPATSRTRKTESRGPPKSCTFSLLLASSEAFTLDQTWSPFSPKIATTRIPLKEASAARAGGKRRYIPYNIFRYPMPENDTQFRFRYPIINDDTLLVPM